jgi:enhancing lycopene biosynthesis protein 2
MAKRVLVVLSGCGAGDGSDIHETVLTLLAIERSGARAICAAPEPALAQASRLSRGPIEDLAKVSLDDFDGLIIPGGAGVGDVLSNYASKAQVCDVHPQLAVLLKGALSSHRPMGFMGLAAVLVARVLGPVAGVRVTLGPRTAAANKHAAVMGADVRPCALTDIFIDKKTRVITTGVFLHEEIRLTQAAASIEKLVRTVVHLSRDRSPAPPPQPGERPPNERPPEKAPAPPAGDTASSSATSTRPGPRAPMRRPVTPGRGSA